MPRVRLRGFCARGERQPMIIDCHSHVSAPAELWAYKAAILSHRGAHGRGKVEVTDEAVVNAANGQEMGPVRRPDMLKRVRTYLKMSSPRTSPMMHSQKPGRLVHWFVEECNYIIYRETQLLKDAFVGVA